MAVVLMFQGTLGNVEPSAFVVTSDALERRFNQVEKSDLGLDLKKAGEVKRSKKVPYLNWDGGGVTCLQVLGKTELITKILCLNLCFISCLSLFFLLRFDNL